MRATRHFLSVVAVIACTPVLAGDPTKGAELLRKCKACHEVGPEARHRVGPALADFLGKTAGTQDGFRYSKAMRAAGENGLIWTDHALDLFLKKPRGQVPGTRMSFSGLTKPEDRQDVIAYLHQVLDLPSKPQDGITLDPAILALEGDPEYGEYLSSECKTCHQADGGDDGIPSIVGWAEADFVIAMQSYKMKERSNPVMQMLAGRLANDEIAALAAYFATLGE